MPFDDRLSPSESDAFNEGFEAAFNGEDELLDNPYDGGTNEHLSWNDGFRDYFEQQDYLAREEHRKLRFESRDPVLARLRTLTLAQLGALVGDPPSTWHGRCYEIASKLVKALGWTDAAAVYGLYLGPIDTACTTFRPARRSVTRHGWVVTREGVIVDPTAWVFEAADPYVKVLQPGEDLHFECHEWYDEGAETLADLARGEFPDAAKGDKMHRVRSKKLFERLRQHAQSRKLSPVVGSQGFTAAQLSWLCRTPYSYWGAKDASALYALVEAAGLHAVIPTDYRARAAREQGWSAAA